MFENSIVMLNQLDNTLMLWKGRKEHLDQMLEKVIIKISSSDWAYWLSILHWLSSFKQNHNQRCLAFTKHKGLSGFI